MTVRVNPRIERAANGTIYGIDQNGCFDMDLSARIDRVSLEGTLENLTEVGLETTPTQILVQLTEQQIATFTGNNPLDEFSISMKRTNKSFFRTGFADDTTSGLLSTYTDINEILGNSCYHTTELCDLLRYIPEEQLSHFGVACLKEIIR